MYEVDVSAWVRVASLHFEGPACGGYNIWITVFVQLPGQSCVAGYMSILGGTNMSY
jgi:hypothetical protein